LQIFAAEISLIERCDWSMGSVYKHQYETSTMLFTSGFQKFISGVKSAHFQNKNFQIFLTKWNFEINFQCEIAHARFLKIYIV